MVGFQDGPRIGRRIHSDKVWEVVRGLGGWCNVGRLGGGSEDWVTRFMNINHQQARHCQPKQRMNIPSGKGQRTVEEAEMYFSGEWSAGERSERQLMIGSRAETKETWSARSLGGGLDEPDWVRGI